MGFVKLMLICLSLFIAGVVAAQNLEASDHTSDPAEGNWIELQGQNSVIVPSVTFAGSDLGWNYPYTAHPVYNQNQVISGTFFGAQDLAGGTIELRIAELSRSSFLAALNVTDGGINLTNASRASGPLKLNETADATFAFPGMTSGIYALYVTDENSSAVRSVSPVIVAEKDIEVDTPDEISAGDLLPVSVKLKDGSDGHQLHYGAFIVSAEDYRNLSMKVTGDGTLKGTLITLAWNEGQLDIDSDFDLSWGLFASMLMIFPENSAAALQDSADGEIDLYMITEDGWEPGTYILTCCVISEGFVVGLNQTELVIV